MGGGLRVSFGFLGRGWDRCWCHCVHSRPTKSPGSTGMWRNPERSASINYTHLTPDKERAAQTLPAGNLKDHIPFLTPDVIVDASSVILDLPASIERECYRRVRNSRLH